MKLKIKILILFPIFFLLLGCGDSDSDFKSKIKFYPANPYIVGVNGLSDFIMMYSGDMAYSHNPMEDTPYYGKADIQQDISYDEVEAVKLKENRNHIYYATNCTESGHLEHEIRNSEVNVINLSDLDISSHLLTLNYSDKNITIPNKISPCSITPIFSIKDFKYLLSSDMTVHMDGKDGYMGYERYDLSDAHIRLVGLDIIIFEDYQLKLIATFSYELEMQISEWKYEKEVEFEREHYDDDKDTHHWDWD